MTVEAMAAVGKPGPKEDLPPQHLQREFPVRDGRSRSWCLRGPIVALRLTGPTSRRRAYDVGCRATHRARSMQALRTSQAQTDRVLRTKPTTGFRVVVSLAMRGPVRTTCMARGARSRSVLAQRGETIAGTAQRAAERHRVFERLRRALSGVGQHRMRRIAEQRDRSGAPSGQWIANEQFVQPHVDGGRRNGAELVVEIGGEPPEDRLGLERASSHLVREQRHVPIDHRRARLDDADFDPRAEVEDEVTAVEQVDGRRCAAQGEVAARPRRGFLRVELPADDRGDAVSADQDVPRCGRAVGQSQPNVGILDVERDGVAARWRCLAADRIEERAVQRRARDDGWQAALVKRVEIDG